MVWAVGGQYAAAGLQDAETAAEAPWRPGADAWAATCGFTPRQRELLAQLLAGESLQQGAAALQMSEWTARSHLRAMRTRAGVRSLGQLLACAVVASGGELASAAAPLARTHRLTPRETHVLELVLQGHSGPEIATELRLSHHTVRSHLKLLREKCQVHRVSALVPLAAR